MPGARYVWSVVLRCLPVVAVLCRGRAGRVSARVDAMPVPTPMPVRVCVSMLGALWVGWVCPCGRLPVWLAVYTWCVCAAGELYRHGFGFGCCVVLACVLYLVHRKAGAT